MLNALTVTVIEVFFLKFMVLNISNKNLEIPNHTVIEVVMGVYIFSVF